MPQTASSTARAAAAWLCSTGSIAMPSRATCAFSAVARIFASGPIRIGSSRPWSDLDRRQHRLGRAGMDDRGAEGRQLACLPDEALVAIAALQRDLGQPGARPFHRLRRRHHRRGAVEHDLAALVGAARVEQHDPPLRPLLARRDRDGDRVARRDRLQEPQLLAEIDRAGARQPGAEHGRDQRRGPHAMGDDMAELVGRGEGGVEMRRVDVAGDGGEEVDVVAPDDAHQRGALADSDLVEGAVPEQVLVHPGLTSAEHIGLAHRRAVHNPCPGSPWSRPVPARASNAPRATPPKRATRSLPAARPPRPIRPG